MEGHRAETRGREIRWLTRETTAELSEIPQPPLFLNGVAKLDASRRRNRGDTVCSHGIRLLTFVQVQILPPFNHRQ